MARVYQLLDEQEPFSEKNGGAISRWAANVLREGDEIIVCPWADTSWAFPEERIFSWGRWNHVGRIHPILFRLPWKLQLLSYRRIFAGLLKKLDRGDLIYVHNRPACAAVLSEMAPEYGIKVVLHMHNSLLLRANAGQIEALRKVPIVFCSEFLRKEVNAAYPGHFETTYIVYNGADDKKFGSAGSDRDPVPTVIFTGRVIPKKGAHLLLKAMQVLQEKGIEAKCRVVGGATFGNNKPTPYMKELQRLKPANTELMGYMTGDSVAKLLRASSIFCCPSIWNDPFPLAPIEAMATGLPVVATNVGGLPEMLAYGGGVLVAPNSVGELADALEKLIKDSAYREEMSQQARASFHKHFLWSSVRDQYLQVVQAVSC